MKFLNNTGLQYFWNKIKYMFLSVQGGNLNGNLNMLGNITENEDGSTGTITLNESAENFAYIEIFYRDISKSIHNAVDSVKIDNANGKYINAKIFGPVSGAVNRLRYALTTYQINSTQISVVDFLAGYTLDSTISYFGAQEIAITKVVGYR